ncbi:MAG TPA: hypothetical protein VGP92_16685 [Acidimicrobiia bacterium]|nr:hypothetical protein [Acidimicrobiia bacterium]
MTEPSPDLDARLARLAARKAGPGAALPTRTPPAGPAQARRRHPAAAGRILSVGLSSSAFLSMVAGFGAQTPASAASNTIAAATRAQTAGTATARPTTSLTARPPKVVVKDVHHVIYVDQWGRPIPAASVPKVTPTLPSPSQPPAGSGPAPSNRRDTSGVPSWTAPPPPNSGPGSTAPAAPSSPATPAPPGPPPTNPRVTPAPTTPPVTSAPVTVVTAPPPPPPPVCSGTKCP